MDDTKPADSTNMPTPGGMPTVTPPAGDTSGGMGTGTGDATPTTTPMGGGMTPPPAAEPTVTPDTGTMTPPAAPMGEEHKPEDGSGTGGTGM